VRVNSIEETEAVASHLESVLNSLYGSLGELAPRLGDDAIVVAVFEMARLFGECAHRLATLRAHRNDVAPLQAQNVAVISAVLERAVDLDASGAYVLYVVSSLVGPRLLISLRDASAGATGPGDVALRARVSEVATVLVAQIQRVGELARGKTSFDDPDALQSARELDQMLTLAGFGESFGLSH
jgi:hypothetical protein